MSGNEFRNEDVILNMIHERVDVIREETGRKEDELLGDWNIVCEEIASEFEQEGLVSSAAEARRWIADDHLIRNLTET